MDTQTYVNIGGCCYLVVTVGYYHMLINTIRYKYVCLCQI